MGEFEEKLNSILSSPKDMEKILGLARELSGSLGGGVKSQSAPKPKEPATMPFGDFDPKMLSLISRIMGEYNSAANDKTALITSIKPYIRQERRSTLDKAVKIAKLAHIAKIAFSELNGGGYDFNI